MLSLFPELLFLAPFSALFIRVAVAAAFAYTASKRLPEPDMSVRALGVVEGIGAVMFFLGLYAQAAALVGLAIVGVYAFAPRFRIFPVSTVWLLFVLCLSLLITGAGPLAFDLPL